MTDDKTKIKLGLNIRVTDNSSYLSLNRRNFPIDPIIYIFFSLIRIYVEVSVLKVHESTYIQFGRPKFTLHPKQQFDVLEILYKSLVVYVVVC